LLEAKRHLLGEPVGVFKSLCDNELHGQTARHELCVIVWTCDRPR
jgi:hypothetical protein